MNNHKIPKILVVDDELGMREGCKRILVSEGYDVKIAEDGEKGLETYQSNGQFDLALIDLKMPKLNGMELIEKITDIDKDIIIFVITAYAGINSAVQATKLGAYGYIPKPFTPDELLMHVKNGLEKRALIIEAKQLREEREKRLLEVAFERSKSNTIINCMTDGVLVVNKIKQIVLRNSALSRIIPSLSDIIYPSNLEKTIDIPELNQLIDEVLESKSCIVIASKEITIDQCTYMVNACPVLEINGESLGAVCVLRDITALKKLEVTKSMFVSMVAHELKSPLAAIESYLNLILSGMAGDDPERDKKWMEKALARSVILRTMVNELLNLTAIETGKFNIKRTPLKCFETLKMIVETNVDKAAERNIKINFNSKDDEELPSILADRNAFISIFSNLIDNAVKYNKDDGEVNVNIENAGSEIRIIVQDNGLGMSEEDKNRIFDEFFRIKNESTENISGTGLGLSLVKKLVDLHNGRITVESQPGKGSKFNVWLPTVNRFFDN